VRGSARGKRVKGGKRGGRGGGGGWRRERREESELLYSNLYVQMGPCKCAKSVCDAPLLEEDEEEEEVKISATAVEPAGAVGAFSACTRSLIFAGVSLYLFCAQHRH
jgi:hypothetical protein